MRAKKSFGQHFLINEDLARRIAESLQGRGFEKIVEVGPGQGVLTKYLAETERELFVVEADQDMVAYLKKNYPQLGDHIIAGDFLKTDLNAFVQGESFGLIGNFPYNISSQIIFKMLEYKTQIPEMVGMFQREVADRIVAAPGTKTYGVISVLVQTWYEGKVIIRVAPGNFNPPPKVQSAVIRLTRKENMDLGCDEKLFRQIVKQTFGQRRKMLRNTLKSFLPDGGILEAPFFQKRPEQLSLEDFIEITQRVEAARS